MRNANPIGNKESAVAADADCCARVSALLRAVLAAMVIAVGILSQIRDSWPSPLPHRGSLHALFGILLCLCVVERFYARFHRGPRMSIADIRPLSRHLSRLVYLLLYLLMFLHLVIVSAAPHRALLSSPEDFQSYLACGVLALVMIQALAALCHHLVVHGEQLSLGLVQRNGRLT
jgi:cytochrome b561